MCKVTKENFHKIYPQIVDDLRNSTFIAIDCEFSGLRKFDSKCSLFDTPQTRFRKLQAQINNFQIIQFGLSTFKYERDNSSFSASSYSFYLKPGIGLGPETFVFLLQSVNFLCKHNFDFNTLMYKGIHYLNKVHEPTVLKHIKNGNHELFLESLEEIQTYCSRVAEWSARAKEEEEIVLETNGQTKIFVCVLHREIRKRFQNCWTYLQDNDDVLVRKINKAQRKALAGNKQEEARLRKNLLDCILGFSRVVKEIQNLKKPIVGHNPFFDLLLIYKQFYNPNRVTYRQFKKDITTLFPRVYDTKRISYRLRDIVEKDLLWKRNRLSDLYSYLKKGKGATLVLFTPPVEPRRENFGVEDSFHDAGFDSYCTGFCFLKMAHVFAQWDKDTGKFVSALMPMTSSWLLGAVREMENQVNLSQGTVSHIVLDGEDPVSSRKFLYVESKTSQPLDAVKIKNLISKYSFVDIQLFDSHRGVLGVAHPKFAWDILSKFKNHPEFKVTQYSFFRHTLTGRILVSGALIASVVVSALLTTRGWFKHHLQ